MSSRLEEAVADVLGLPVDEIRPDTGPATVNWSSLQHLQIVAAVEDRYGVSLAPREIRGVRSVADLREVLRSRGVAE